MAEIAVPLLGQFAPKYRATDPLDKGLIGEWRFDRNTGSVLPDYSGNGNHGIITAGTWTSTQYGMALEFDGANTWVDLQAVPSPGIPVSFEFFVRTHETGGDLDGIIDTAPGLGSTARVLNGNFEWWNSEPVFSLNLVANEWDHLILSCWLEGSDRRVAYYRNGALVDVYEGSFNEELVWELPVLGNVNSGGAGWWDGDMALFRLYNRILNPAEASARYQIVTARASGVAHNWLVVFGEEAVGGDDYFRTLSDLVGTTDILSLILNYYRSLTDTAIISDELSKVLTAKRTVADPAGVTDTVSTARGLVKTLADSIGITDLLSNSVGRIISLADSVGITDTLSTAIDKIVSIADGIGVTDLISKIGTFFIRPDGDQSIGQWTDELGGTTNIYQSIDEPAPPVDSDYIQSPFSPQTQSYICTLSDALDPGINTGHTLSYRYRKFPVTSQQVDLTVTLLQGVAELTSWNHVNVASGWITANQLMSSGIVANITDYTDLRLKFEADIV